MSYYSNVSQIISRLIWHLHVFHFTIGPLLLTVATPLLAREPNWLYSVRKLCPLSTQEDTGHTELDFFSLAASTCELLKGSFQVLKVSRKYIQCHGKRKGCSWKIRLRR